MTLLTAIDVAKRLQISRRSAYRVIRECVHVRVAGGQLRVTPAEDLWDPDMRIGGNGYDLARTALSKEADGE